MNRAGTQLAIVWNKNISESERENVLRSTAEQRKLTFNELTGESRAQALQEFSARTNWYRVASVDRLSEEEAGIIAARLVWRLQAKIALQDDQKITLLESFTALLQQRLLNTSSKSRAVSSKQIEEEMLKVAQKHFGENGITALKEAMAQGYRPLANEK